VPDRSEIGPYLGSLRATSRGVTINSALPGHLRGKAISPKAPRPQTWTTAEPDRRRAGPLGDRSLPRKSSGYIQGFYHKLSLAWHLRGKAISPKAPRPQTWTTAEPDRSEIGPYLGSLRTTSRGFTINSALPGHLRGKAISPKAPRPQTWTAAGPDRSEIGPYLGSLRTTFTVVTQGRTTA